MFQPDDAARVGRRDHVDTAALGFGAILLPAGLFADLALVTGAALGLVAVPAFRTAVGVVRESAAWSDRRRPPNRSRIESLRPGPSFGAAFFIGAPQRATP